MTYRWRTRDKCPAALADAHTRAALISSVIIPSVRGRAIVAISRSYFTYFRIIDNMSKESLFGALLPHAVMFDAFLTRPAVATRYRICSAKATELLSSAKFTATFLKRKVCDAGYFE